MIITQVDMTMTISMLMPPGGTPYSSVPGREVGPRVLRGLRLHRPQAASEQLFQLMLACWMTDPDERPTVNHKYDF
jgi:hypothetical protein